MLVMVGKQQLKVHLTHLTHLGSIGKYFSTIALNGIYAGSNGAASTLDLNKTETASTYLVYILKIA